MDSFLASTPPRLTYTLLRWRLMCVAGVFIVLYRDQVTHYSAQRTGHAAAVVMTPDPNLDLETRPALTMAEVPVCHRTCGLSFESVSGRLTLAQQSLVCLVEFVFVQLQAD